MTLKILIAEDLPSDAELIQRELKKMEFNILYKVVDTKEDFIKEINNFSPDIILSDYNLPEFSGLEALEIVKKINQEIPFIIVTGSINETVAVECMKKGAWDYVIKEYLIKLPTAIESALEKRKIILEKKNALEELEKSEKRFKSLIETAPLATIVVNKDMKIIYANKRALEISGLSNIKEAIGRKLSDFIASDNLEFVLGRVNKALKGEKLSPAVEKIVTIKGEERFVNVNSIGVKWDNENVVVTMFDDITEIKMLEHQLIQSQKMEAIGKLAGGIAHDFNNILTVINGYSELLLNIVEKSNPIYNKVLQIYNAGQKASKLTKQILAFSRKQLITPKVININNIIKQNLKMLKRLIRENIEIKTELGENIDFIKADPIQLEQIFLNLTINSVDAMPEGGVIEIRTNNIKISDKYIATNLNIKEGNYVILTFTDTGSGINEDIIDKIFDPFFTTKKSGEGSGLGLSTVYGIVKQNNGHIFVNSELGKGTTFKIFWPAISSNGNNEIEVESNFTYSNSKKNENILLIEDDLNVKDVISLGLKEFGYNVFEALSKEEAIKIISENDISLLITDIIMPLCNGVEIANELEKINNNLKVLFISGYPDNHFQNNLSKIKNNFLQKPFSFETLLKKVKELLSNQ